MPSQNNLKPGSRKTAGSTPPKSYRAGPRHRRRRRRALESPALKSGWRRPYAVILACHAGVFLAFSAAFPFISLYVQQLAITDQKQAAGWAGSINGIATALVSVMNPIWGTLADRWGIKAGLVRCLICCVAGLSICAVATQPEHLLMGRLVQAVGSIVPTNQLGATMGLMQTAQSLSGALGPAIGDTSVQHDTLGFVAGLRYVVGTPALRALIVLSFGFHPAYQMVWTFLPLRIQEIIADPSLVGRWSGAAALGDALGIAAGASITGWFGTRLRAEPRALVMALCALATLGGAVVLIRAGLGAHAQPGRRGVTYGVGQSAFAGGFSAGALIGSAVAANTGVVDKQADQFLKKTFSQRLVRSPSSLKFSGSSS
ncbi:MAG TPA: MFS transporter, partial [Chloroflexota bacterium]|nr:MFS transporter [Chloroflexota bacterium]